MPSLSGRERFLAVAALIALSAALIDAVSSLDVKRRELDEVRRQVNDWRARGREVAEVLPSRGVARGRLTKEELLEMVARAGRRLDSIQVSQTQHGVSAVFAGEPAAVWMFYGLVSAADDVMVDELSLKSTGSRLSGTLRLAVAP